MCNLDKIETSPIIERLLARVPKEEFTKDKDEDTSNADKAEAAVIEQVKKMSLQPINVNINPQLLLMSYRCLIFFMTSDSPFS